MFVRKVAFRFTNLKRLMIPILGMGMKREEPRQIVAVGATMPEKGMALKFCCLESSFFFEKLFGVLNELRLERIEF